MKKSLLEEAKNVLDNNFQLGGFTIPSKGLYPFQWKWDSGFISIGYAPVSYTHLTLPTNREV